MSKVILSIFVIILSNKLGISGIIINDCSYTVTSGIVSYNGCKEPVGTDSLTNSKSDYISIYSFKGIPYAEPPIGSLRFRKTVPKIYSKPTNITANHYRNPCLQPLSIDFPLPSGFPSENCLYLNVWTPTLNNSANLPVMFWIHGGGFFTGSGSQSFGEPFDLNGIYEGNQLAIRDVVVVTINYRLGVFGFLYGNSSEAPGNMGLWDQAMALNWTKLNIRAFGGNPESITLFGESAGSTSITNHIISNITRNWFQRAAMQSASGYLKLYSRDKEYSYEVARRFASNPIFILTGICNDNNWIECLRNKSSTELLLAETIAILWNPSNPWYFSWFQEFQPISGDEFTPISINKAVKEGNFRQDIKILIGHNEMEGLFLTQLMNLIRGLLGRFLPSLPVVSLFSKNIIYNYIKNIFIFNETMGEIVAEKYAKLFANESIFFNRNLLRKSAAHSLGDYLFTCPIILFGACFSKSCSSKGQVFQYKLTYAPSLSVSKLSQWNEASHADEIPLLFGRPFKPVQNIFWSREDKRLSKEIMDVWTHFARYDELPLVNGNVWPAYSLNNDSSVNASYLELHADNDRLGKVHTNGYDGINDGYSSPVIQNCFNFWDEIISEQF